MEATTHARGLCHPCALPQEALTHADQVLVGEGELTILDVVEGRITDKIIQYLPVIDLHAVPNPDYSVLKAPVKAADIMTSRGCPFRCSFCTTSRMFAPHRERSVDSVIAEIKHYHELVFEYMNFKDDNFTADKEPLAPKMPLLEGRGARDGAGIWEERRATAVLSALAAASAALVGHVIRRHQR